MNSETKAILLDNDHLSAKVMSKKLDLQVNHFTQNITIDSF